MKRTKIYRVKALDSMFESAWYFNKNECRKIIDKIMSDEIRQLVCGSEFIIEECELK